MLPLPESFDDFELEPRPYRGAEPYRFEDGDLFFGRDAAARLIVGKILGTPATILHAPSGAGKTSLLNTRILPGLEANGLTPILLRLWEEPLQSVRHEIVNQTFPEPGREVECLRTAREAVGLDGAVGLAEALDRFDELRHEDAPRASRVLRAVRDDVPFLARLLNGTLELERYLEAVNFVTAGGLWPPGEHPDRHRQIPLADLERSLSAAEAIEAHAELVESLSAGNQSLAALVSAVCDVCTGALRDFELVLCFDQFEEIFTRFHTTTADRARDGGDAAQVRAHFFDQLRDLARTAFDLEQYSVGAGESSSRHRLPVRLLFSLRDEYLARMDWLTEILREGFKGSHHLDLMTPDEARQAIVNPAVSFQVEYEEACIDAMLADLTLDERVEPSQLSIVCDRFWSRALDAHEEDSPDKLVLTLAELEAAGSIEGLLEAIVVDTLADFDRLERLEALDIITGLQIDKGEGGAVRQIVQENALKERALRTRIRSRVVERLKERYFLRLHRFRGSTLIEVTHEALLRAFNRVIDEERANQPEFFEMTGLLNRLRDQEQQVASFGSWPCVHRRDLEAIEKIAQFVDWRPHPGVCELVLRSWMDLPEAQIDDFQPSIEEWAARYAASVEAHDDLDPREAFLRYPSLWRLERLAAQAPRRWSEEDRARMMRALLHLDHSRHATLTSEWTRRVTAE